MAASCRSGGSQCAACHDGGRGRGVAGTGPGTLGEHSGHADGKFADSLIIVLLFIILFYDIHGNLVP